MTTFKDAEQKRRSTWWGTARRHVTAEMQQSQQFYGGTMDDLEDFLCEVGQSWGQRRSGRMFYLRNYFVPFAICAIGAFIAVTLYDYVRPAGMRIWIIGGIMLIAVAYVLLEAFFIKRRWFVIYRSKVTMELQFWTGTLAGFRQAGAEGGHIFIRVDETNEQLRVSCEEPSSTHDGEQYFRVFHTLPELRQGVSEAWVNNSFVYWQEQYVFY